MVQQCRQALPKWIELNKPQSIVAQLVCCYPSDKLCRSGSSWISRNPLWHSLSAVIHLHLFQTFFKT